MRNINANKKVPKRRRATEVLTDRYSKRGGVEGVNNRSEINLSLSLY
jgi:hypothetical protein